MVIAPFADGQSGRLTVVDGEDALEQGGPEASEAELVRIAPKQPVFRIVP